MKSSVFVNNMKIINMLISKLLEYIDKYSSSIANSLHIAWSNYQNKDSSTAKKERSIKKIEKKINQLINIEAKKKLNDQKSLDNLKGLVELSDISSKYKTNYIDMINDSLTYGELLEKLVLNYIEMEKKEEQQLQNIKEKVVLPKRKKDLVISKVVDKNNYLYFNFKKKGDILLIDKKSLNNEYSLYCKCLKEKTSFDIWNNLEYKLSPFEKRRKIYIQSMYNLEKELLELKNKKIDITYPIEKYYLYAKMLVDNLEKEVMFFDNDKSIFDKLKGMTLEKYGCDRLLTLYDELVMKVNDSELDEYVKLEFFRTANVYKKKSIYIEFKEIENVVPTLENVLNIVNRRLINSVENNIKFYFVDFENKMIKMTKYMSIDEMILFYNVFKNILFRKGLKISGLINKYMLLREVMVNLFIKKFSLDKDEIIDKYLDKD